MKQNRIFCFYTSMNILSLIFDMGCLLCGHDDSFSEKYGLCRRCASNLLFGQESGSRCRKCSRLLISEDGICTRCRNESFLFDSNISFWEYTGVAKDVIGLYKFKGQRRIGHFLALAVYRHLKRHSLLSALLVPAPCSPGRLRKNGYNHMEYVCRVLKRVHGIPFAAVLRRRQGRQLKKLSRDDRKVELVDKLYMEEKDKTRFKALSQGRKVILLDDIFTTGSTASACAGLLKENGVNCIDILTFALD